MPIYYAQRVNTKEINLIKRSMFAGSDRASRPISRLPLNCKRETKFSLNNFENKQKVVAALASDAVGSSAFII